MRLEFLTPDELFQITKACKHTTQIKRLRKLGYIVRPDGNGAPLVLRAHVEAKFGIGHADRIQGTEPDWSYLNAQKASN